MTPVVPLQIEEIQLLSDGRWLVQENVGEFPSRIEPFYLIKPDGSNELIVSASCDADYYSHAHIMWDKPNKSWVIVHRRMLPSKTGRAVYSGRFLKKVLWREFPATVKSKYEHTDCDLQWKLERRGDLIVVPCHEIEAVLDNYRLDYDEPTNISRFISTKVMKAIEDSVSDDTTEILVIDLCGSYTVMKMPIDVNGVAISLDMMSFLVYGDDGYVIVDNPLE